MEISAQAVEAQVEETHWWFVGRRKLLATILRNYHVPMQALVLDIGTGTGTNLRLLRDLGFHRTEGVEKSQAAIDFCTQKGFHNVEKGNLGRLPFPDARFDVVLATDVVEHVEDDFSALREIRRVLADDGLAILTVPAFMSLWGRQDDVSHHVRRYRLGQFRDLVRRVGFECGESFYFNYLLFLPIWGARQLIRLAGIPLESEGQVNTPLLNSILKIIFAVDVWSAPRLKPPFGVSMLLVVRKRTSNNVPH